MGSKETAETLQRPKGHLYGGVAALTAPYLNRLKFVLRNASKRSNEPSGTLLTTLKIFHWRNLTGSSHRGILILSLPRFSNEA